jgi:hypothetical protein
MLSHWGAVSHGLSKALTATITFARFELDE